jgi:hypothetical protein
MSGIVLAGKILRYEKRIPKRTINTEYAAGSRAERISAHLISLFLPLMPDYVNEAAFEAVQNEVEHYVAVEIVNELRYKHKSSKEKEAIKKKNKAKGAQEC